MKLSTPDISDKYPEAKALKPILKNLGGRQSFFGPIETLKCPDDNSFVKEQLNSSGDGKILVVDANGIDTVALLGDMIAEAGVKNGWSGIVINGYIRDIEFIQIIDIGVYAVNSYPKKTDKSKGTGEKDVPIKIGNVRNETGCWIYVDTNGWIDANKEFKF